MRLLDPKDAKEETRKADQERLQRVRKMNEEESAMTRKINQLHDGAKVEKRMVSEHLAKFKADASAVIASLNKKIKGLFNEVELLEARKAKALEPINELKKEAEKRMAIALEEEAANRKEDERLASENERLLDWKEDLADLEGEISLRNSDSIKKNSKVVSEEALLRESEKNLSAHWLQFYKDVEVAKKEIARKEKEVEDARLANEAFKTSLDRKEIEQREHDRQIADRYGTLGRAIEEARQKHGVNL